MNAPEIYSTKEAWLAARATGLGSSDVAAALGENKYKSPHKLWSEKTGLSKPDAENAKMYAGTVGEESAAKMFAYLNPDIEVITPLDFAFSGAAGQPIVAMDGGGVDEDSKVIWRDPAKPHAMATPDRLTMATARVLGLLELKCPNWRNRHQWDDGPPTQYVIQALHQFTVLRACGVKLEELRLAAWFGSDDLVVFSLPCDDTVLTESIASGVDAFWKRVESKRAPPISLSGSDSDHDSLAAVYPKEDPGTMIELPADLVERWVKAKSVETLAESNAKALAADIKAHMGAHEVGLYKGSKICTWKEKTVNYQAKDASTATYRTLTRARNWLTIMGLDA